MQIDTMQSHANWLSAKPVWSVLGSGTGSWLIHKSGLIKGMPRQPNLCFSRSPVIDSFRSSSIVDYWGFSMRQQDCGGGLMAQNHTWRNMREGNEGETPSPPWGPTAKVSLCKAQILWSLRWALTENMLYWHVCCTNMKQKWNDQPDFILLAYIPANHRK